MGAPRHDDADNVLQPLSTADEMQLAASALEFVGKDSALVTTLEKNSVLATELGHLFSHSNRQFESAFPGATRKALDVGTWRKAGYRKVVAFSKLLNLKEF